MFLWVVEVVVVITWKVMEQSRSSNGKWGTWLDDNNTNSNILATYIKKCLKAKEGLWKLKYFNMQKYNLQKIL